MLVVIMFMAMAVTELIPCAVAVAFNRMDQMVFAEEIQRTEDVRLVVQIFRSSAAKDWGCMDVANALTTTIRLAVGLI